jgi:5-oxoprolinase (ATP-hydrolysing)
MVPLFRRADMRYGNQVFGPAVIVEDFTTNIIEEGWQAHVMEQGEIWLFHYSRLLSSHSLSIVDPTLLELMSNHFTAIATQMGITLRNTATSVNVKERLDFSCAIFTASGELVVNAPHIPVHLGAMGETVRRIIADNPAMQPGDVFVTNDPFRGGSHLPDVTLVTPVYSEAGQRLFFTASRAHHAEIGGITPGSMPPFSRNLAEEGVLIRNFKLLDAGISRMDELRELLSSGPYPSRSPETNLTDITAQLAANQQGVLDLRSLIDRYTEPVVLTYMRHIQDAAERKLRAALANLPPGRHEAVDHLDDGTPICVAITIQDDEATIDFTGTGGVSSGNLNANRAIVTAAVMYVLRLIVGEDIPLNQGVLTPVRIVLPECVLNPPEHDRPEDCPAVVGGNVETSQRIVDVLIAALGLSAASQGTMNNVLFGDATFGYYETICGGSGATAQANGADAVHTHMTNTRLTDPEVLEARYPVRLREFSIRRGSGGAGQHRGGDGVIRRMEFLQPLTLSILSQRRGPYPPQGMNGGSAGALGRNTLTRADGMAEPLPGAVQVEVNPGDVLSIETPGGGGWGKSKP